MTSASEVDVAAVVIPLTECPWCHASWGMAGGKQARRDPGFEKLCGTCWSARVAQQKLASRLALAPMP